MFDPQNGLPANVGFHQQKPPSYLDLPTEMFTDAVDKPDPSNPVGAKGIGEPLLGASASALLCAISDAMGGHVFNRTPVVPDMIVNQLAGRPQPRKPLQHQHAIRSSHNVPDMMPSFELYQPDTLEGAVKLAKDAGTDGWLLAGGQDSYDWFKDRAKRPDGADRPHRHRRAQGHPRDREAGSKSARSPRSPRSRERPLVKSKYAVLARAAARVASPQIRNAGTLGGNLCQDARCWYYRAGVDCYRAGGNTCYADTPQGQNREHCLFGAARCIAVSPSDTAPAVVALEARIVIAGDAGRARGAGRGILHRAGGGHHAA